MPIAILFGLVVMAILLPTLMSATQQNSTIVLGTVAAQQLKQLTSAAQQYIQANFSAVLGASSTTTPATITVPMLIATGFLPQGFQALNPYGQTWQVEALQAPAGQIQALVMSIGGTPVPTRDAARITAQAGAEGGIVGGGTGTLSSPTCTAGQACGAFGGWKIATSGYTGLGPGSLLGLLAFNSAGQLNQQYLYRVAVPGQPQLNQMQTNLDMGNNSVNNANNVTAAGQIAAGTLNVSGNGTVGGSVTMANGRVVTWNQVPEGGVLQLQGANGVNIFLESLNGTFRLVNNPWNAQLFSVDQNGNVAAAGSITTPSVVQGGYVNSTGNVNAQGSVTAGDTVQAGSRVVLGSAFGGANPGWGCSPNGEIATNPNGSGQLMTCINGLWQSAQGASQGLQQGQWCPSNQSCGAWRGPIPIYYGLPAGYAGLCWTNDPSNGGVASGPVFWGPAVGWFPVWYSAADSQPCATAVYF